MNKNVSLLLILALSLFSIRAKADDKASASAAPVIKATEPYASALLGGSIVTSSGGGSELTYTGRIGTGFYSTPGGILSIGLVVNHASQSEAVGAANVNGSYTILAGEIIGRKLFGSGLYAGSRIGVALLSADINSNFSPASYSASAVSFTVGPVLGYEFPIIPMLNLDLDLSWISISGATFDFPTLGSITTNVASAFLVQGGVTFHW
ncbi:MAG: hypothetical protein P4M08_05950 [Oligoflexia bacterium]|nr:hypothetical protein [Oligoflexia bacterium]